MIEGVSKAELEQAVQEGTARGGVACPVDEAGEWIPPSQRISTPIDQVKGPEGLREWANDDLIPSRDDLLGERLYCIRWVDQDGTRHYCAPDEKDLQRETLVLELLRQRFSNWQAKGYIPSARIEPGDKTDEPITTRGWTYWH